MEIIKHFSHQHELSLSETKRENVVRCKACDEYCDEATEERDEHFSHYHKHPLLLFENMPANRIYCRVCGTKCSDPTYGCFQCRFFLHQSCSERHLPQEIKHFFHPCPLTLYTVPANSSYNCRACHHNSSKGAFCYGCSRCNFEMDVDCTLLLPTTQQILHFLHGHPLSPISNINADDEYHNCACYVCGKGCTDDPVTYACGCAKNNYYEYCKDFYLHKSCAELPQQIFHPFHQIPNHPLILRQSGYLQCHACRKYYTHDHSMAYDCQSCRFCLDIECGTAEMAAAVTYEGHDHLLQFKEILNLGNKLHCNACNKSAYESYAFSCLDLDCGFDLHHTCGPLPYTIKHKSHIHPLILNSSPLEDEEDCEPDEFYCDACEEQRVDPFLPIYYCPQCRFVAELKCVFSEVVSSLNGEYGDVMLRNPLGQFGKVITKNMTKEMIQKKDQKQLEWTSTWGDYLRTLSTDEKKEKNILTDRIKETITAEKIEAYDHEEIIMFSDKAYTQFMKFLNHSGFSNDKFRYPWDLSDRENKETVVNVGDYMTTRKLAPILNHLLSNHGDIGAQSTLSLTFKSLYVCMLCKCIDHMRNTMVVDITLDILLDWWTCLKILQVEGFQIGFAFDRLKRVTHAHFGLYVEKEVDNALHQLEKWTRKVERIKSAKSSSIIEECWREASVLKKGKAVTFRLL
ncbi:hypothetical protein FH972_016030 [Carpinus fangiana]|uniref:DC1 domain-containing protein n=1 Tax=Carpinus fangiana TaxID=176857 RepID=A0A5N6RF60_9ROSI|nr:hypothetical protein FH972_016030 [Carpinus fangiana]